ncbi:uncharacterized protein Z518_03335 [Rhinocladiella mackenziei CBS 650.93]|uniref:Uncharacterized protein n=1 Tax=Rhinocladiella mackenziei CBS 650.93 TaxID=1442369 RepID=A0A0D2HDP9_9EURO|nr:uncharacterized protein Z518_03335 [Rhinocladiella mackenziei CBS 650.93]KIX08678.1 hypothetical protein Z518_03335 [Rhinocladiella mackenziei CBS 650.93]
MVYTLPGRLRDKLWPESLPPPGSFDGQTVLVTGATAGLGLAAAQHFTTLGATVIITSRSKAQGEAARGQIAQYTGAPPGKIHALQLDMNEYNSCVALVNELKQSEPGRRGIDYAVLNVGVINPAFVESTEGWEQTIQVNTLSTTLLGLLLLDWMKEMTYNGQRPPHLVFVASRDHLDPDISRWAEYGAKEGVLRHFSSRDNWPVGKLDPNYANSKLMLMYAVEELCKQAVATDGRVLVIINTVCPGLVATDIARSIVKSSPLMKIVVPIYLGFLGKSADYGARFYVTAACASQEQHGKNIQSLFTEEEYRGLAAPNLNSENAQIVKKVVVKEIMDELRAKVPSLHELIP